MNTRVGTLAAGLLLVAAAGCAGSSSPAAPPAAIPSAALNAGLRVTLSATPKAAGSRTITFTAAVSDDDGAGPGYRLDFGDGTSKAVPAPAASCGSGSRTAATPLRTTITLSHHYSKPGTFVAQIAVTSGGGCPLPAPESKTAYTLVSVS